MSQVGFVGQSPAMIAVFDRIIRLSRLSDLPTLITGETGTGKELVARALHAQDPKRRSGPFVALNCAALSSGLVESELFGHRRGAFTSAERDRRGLFRAAEGGVLFLDEVAELDAAVQAKLLRVLQDSRVRAVGDEDDVPVNVRVVAATNRDLRGMVERHEFRADLFHRLTVLSVHIPPLRERRDDVPVLTEHFALKHASVNVMASRQLHPDVTEALTALDLPGNARQLENIVRWALVQNDGTAAIGLGDLPPDVWLQVAEGDAAAGSAAAATITSTAPAAAANADYATRLLAANGWNLSKSLDSCERSILEVALQEAAGNQSHAARRLGITARSVYNMVRRHRLA
jgi:transcriptional regulator with GAF, ATPase, and Fis domain